MQVSNAGPSKYAEACGVSNRERAAMVDWISHAAHVRRLPAPVLFTAIALLDRYVSARGRAGLLEAVEVVDGSGGAEKRTPDIAPLLLAFLTVAAKVLDTGSVLPMSLFVLQTTATPRQVVDAEIAVLSALDYRVSGIVTTCDVLDVFVEWAPGVVDADVAVMAWYLAELTLLEHALLQYRPSELAAACVMLAELLMDRSKTADQRCDRANNSAVCGECEGLLNAMKAPDATVQRAMGLLLAVHQTVTAAHLAGKPYAATAAHVGRLASPQNV